MTADKERQLGKRLDSLDKKIDRVLSYIETDKTTGRKGLFENQQDLANDHEVLRDDLQEVKNGINTDKKVLAAKGTILGFIGGGVLWLIKLLF